jgi:xanthine dehydrogenase accessory factor
VHKELELWQFVSERLVRNELVMLLVVAESSGSSPGRQGYKMAIGADGELFGSVGGGVMEVNLVEQSRRILSARPGARSLIEPVRDQIHRKGVPNSSGMICSGKQTVIFKLLAPENNETVHQIIDALNRRRPDTVLMSPTEFSTKPPKGRTPPNDFHFERITENDFVFEEKLGFKNDLYIVGGGHCALALSELMSKMDFHISIHDDRPDLNTLAKNDFAHEIEVIESYEQIRDTIPSGPNIYVVVMTLGYKSDETVIRELLDKDFKYFGVLGSKAKMRTLMKELRGEGFDEAKLARLHTPIGLPINSRTPEEIAISIAAEIIAVKNAPEIVSVPPGS